MTIVDYILSAGVIGAFFLLGVVCVTAPRRLVWVNVNVLGLGMSERTRMSITQGLGFVVLLGSLWMAWRFFITTV
jgi:hypothetical protein